MFARMFLKTIVLSLALLVSGLGVTMAAAANDCPTRVQTLKTALAESVRVDRTDRSLAKRYLAMGEWLHEQGKHEQARTYLDTAINLVSR